MSIKDKKANDDTYQVGYGRPPKQSQFKPGQSGNRKGRPRKRESLRSIIRKLGEETASISTENGEIKMTYTEWILRAVRQRAMKGDNRATSIFVQLWLDAHGMGPADNTGAIELAEEDRAMLREALIRIGSGKEDETG